MRPRKSSQVAIVPAAPQRARGKRHFHIADLHGVGRLAIKAAESIADLAETIQGGVGGKAFPGADTLDTFRKNARQLSAWLDRRFDTALAHHRHAAFSPEREAVLSALNGVIGDYLAESAHPWAIAMHLRSQGKAVRIERRALAQRFPDAQRKILVMVHGLCRNDLQWRRRGHDHGLALARELGYTPLYLHYNSGRHVSHNGRELAMLLELLVEQWPVEIRQLDLLCHSMGGLVARSACHYAGEYGHSWPRRLRKMVFLGTPHHGSPIERGGNWLVAVLDRNMLTLPLARFGRVRSAGITDLRYGNLLDEDWQGRDLEHKDDCRRPVPLPAGVKCYAVAGAAGRRESDLRSRLLGDGLMMPESALGRHGDRLRDLAFPPARQWIAYGVNHLELLDSRDVYRKLLEWMRG
ncbi:MAG TPA: alpha/beta hydrolase [Burkholderiaceae bacterium]